MSREPPPDDARRAKDVYARARRFTDDARHRADAASGYATSARARLDGAKRRGAEDGAVATAVAGLDDRAGEAWVTPAGAGRPGLGHRPVGVALLDADPDFRSGVPADALASARRVVVVPRLDLEPGRWRPSANPPWPEPVTGVVVVDGVMARHVALGNRVSTQFIGPGDIVDPWGAQDDMLPCEVRWEAYEPVVLAVLDGRFAVAARRWPSLLVVVQRKLCQRADRLAAQSAALQLPRVEERVLAVLWQLAERFGRVRPDGVVVPFQLSHRLIGQLVGARRPTVSLAVKDLAAAGLVMRDDDGSWFVSATSRAVLEPDAVLTSAG